MPTILYEDDAILICEKPPGTPSQADKTGDPDMVSLLSGKGLVLPVHRLDRAVGGVMVFAKTKQAAAVLSKDIAANLFQKTYLAAVCGKAEENGMLTDFLLKNQRLNLSKAVPEKTLGAKKAVLSYRAIGVFTTESSEAISLLEIQLMTGRHHQIRVQLANAGLPIWGDTKYNPAFFRKPGFHLIALRAYRLSLPHPLTRKPLTFEAPPRDQYPFTAFSFYK